MDFESGCWLLAAGWWLVHKTKFWWYSYKFGQFQSSFTATIWIIDSRLGRWGSGSEWREMKRSRWWERSERHQTGPVHPPPTTCLLSWSQPWLRPTTRLVSNHSWWIPPGDRSGDWDQGRTHPLGQAYLVIDVCHSVKIFVIILRKQWQSDQFQILAGYNHNLQDCLLMSRNVVIITRPDTWADPSQ